jgi:hypothetical protein
MEDQAAKPKATSWFDHWLTRAFIIAASVQVAILATSLIKILPNYIVPDHTDAKSIFDWIFGACLMAFAHPLSLMFFLEGLSQITMSYLPQKYQEADSGILVFIFWLLPYWIYSILTACAILIRKRWLFIVIYLVLITVLIVNMASCMQMPLPTGSM